MLLIVFTLLFFTEESYGIQCIHCTDIVLNSSSIPSAFKVAMQAYRTPNCENAHTAKTSSGITLSNCTEVASSGQVNKCGRLVGSLLVSSGYSVNRLELPYYFHIRGCFTVDQSLERGCYRNRRIIDQNRGHFSDYFEGMDSLKLGEFNGVLCINGANNVDPWRKTNVAIRHSYCLVTLIVFVMVYCLS